MWLLISLALADCPADNAALKGSLEAAEGAYAQLETDGFLKNLDEAFAQFDCLDERISISNATRLHWNAALGAFLERDLDLSRKHFLAGRIAQPAGRISPNLAPEGSEVYEAYEALDRGDIEARPIESNAIATYVIDGSVATVARDDLPKLLQIETADGPPANHLLFPGADLPALPAPPVVQKEKKPLKPHVPLMIAGGATMATAGLITAVYQPKAAAKDKNVTRAELSEDELAERRRLQTLGTVVTPTLWVTGAGLTAGGVLVWVM